MTGAELAATDVALPALPAGLGPAAERFARNTLRKSKQTQRTYLSVYGRFTTHLSALTGLADPPPSALTADAVASYLDGLEAQGRSPATVRKERAAINRLTRYLQLVGAIDQSTALEILDVEAVTVSGRPKQRPALDEQTWQRVKDRAAARVLELTPAGRATAPVATRDLAIVVCLGELGLRSEELRRLCLDDITGMRAGSATPWLQVLGKGNRERGVPLPQQVQRALLAWLDVRPPEAAWNPLVFPRLGRQRHDGAFPDATQHSGRAAGRGRRAVVDRARRHRRADHARRRRARRALPPPHPAPHLRDAVSAAAYPRLRRTHQAAGATRPRLARDDARVPASHPRRARAQHARPRPHRPRLRCRRAHAAQRPPRLVALAGVLPVAGKRPGGRCHLARASTAKSLAPDTARNLPRVVGPPGVGGAQP